MGGFTLQEVPVFSVPVGRKFWYRGEHYKRVESNWVASIAAVKLERGQIRVIEEGKPKWIEGEKEIFSENAQPFRILKTVKVVLDSRDSPAQRKDKDKLIPSKSKGRK